MDDSSPKREDDKLRADDATDTPGAGKADAHGADRPDDARPDDDRSNGDGAAPADGHPAKPSGAPSSAATDTSGGAGQDTSAHGAADAGGSNASAGGGNHRTSGSAQPAAGGGGGGSHPFRTALIVIIVLVLLAIAGWYGWQWWQQQPHGAHKVSSQPAATHSPSQAVGPAAATTAGDNFVPSASTTLTAESSSTAQPAAAGSSLGMPAEMTAAGSAAEPGIASSLAASASVGVVAQPGEAASSGAPASASSSSASSARPGSAQSSTRPQPGAAASSKPAPQAARSAASGMSASAHAAMHAQVAQLQGRIDQLAASVAKQAGADDQQLTSLQSALDHTQQANSDLHKKLTSLAQRVDKLESAASALAEQGQRSAERMRLDNVQALLEQAGQRYSLLHDSVGALAALRMARHKLQQVDDPALAGVKRTLDDELSALAATRPKQRLSQIKTLRKLRDNWSSLPLEPINPPAEKQAGGTWDRVTNALSSLVVVEHETAADKMRAANTELAQQVARIDLAQAQAALLNGAPDRAMAAIKRVRKTLADSYDPDSSAVQRAKQRLQKLLAQLEQSQKVDVQLGAALTALRNERSARRMQDSRHDAAGTP